MKIKRGIILLCGSVFLISFLFARSIFKKDQLDSKIEQKSISSVFSEKIKISKLTNMQTVHLEKQDPQQPIALLDIHNYFDEVRELKKCYIEDCQIQKQKSDPRTEYFTIGQQIRQKLLNILEITNMHKLVDSEISDLAREFIENSDGHVQEIALDLLSTQPTSIENLKAILNNVISGNDAELIEQGLLELRRYHSQEENKFIQQSLASAIVYGAPFVSQTISAHSRLFLNNFNFDYFDDLLKQIDPLTIVGKNLKTALQDFRRVSY